MIENSIFSRHSTVESCTDSDKIEGTIVGVTNNKNANKYSLDFLQLYQNYVNIEGIKILRNMSDKNKILI